jgi:chromatin remodeling complex protein RSC6
MPRISKPKASSQVVESKSVVEPVVQEVVVKKTSKPKTVKAEAVKTDVSSAVVQQSDVDTVVENVPEEVVVDLESSVLAQSTEFIAKLNQLSVIISSLKNEYKTLEKKWTRELKVAQKANSKRKRKSGNRSPSGFVKPALISDELASFLEKPSGTEMARTDVTREINKYIRAHNLQDVTNGRKIIPDNKLSSLLKLKNTDELTYFNLQKYMSPHFPKTVKVEAAVSV